MRHSGYFEKRMKKEHLLYLYIYTGQTEGKYIQQKSSGSNEIKLADSGTAFVLTEATDKPGSFII